jgi:poly-gamma-glutamate capsule biosynthesis protein CapA/YwtB (metallophosphatase superfamily)
MAIEDDIATQEAGLAAGVKTVRAPDGRMVEYVSVDERLKALGYLHAKASSAGGVTRTTKLFFVRD